MIFYDCLHFQNKSFWLLWFLNRLLSWDRSLGLSSYLIWFPTVNNFLVYLDLSTLTAHLQIYAFMRAIKLYYKIASSIIRKVKHKSKFSCELYYRLFLDRWSIEIITDFLVFLFDFIFIAMISFSCHRFPILCFFQAFLDEFVGSQFCLFFLPLNPFFLFNFHSNLIGS